VKKEVGRWNFIFIVDRSLAFPSYVDFIFGIFKLKTIPKEYEPVSKWDYTGFLIEKMLKIPEVWMTRMHVTIFGKRFSVDYPVRIKFR
jgi:hypothetical protein